MPPCVCECIVVIYINTLWSLAYFLTPGAPLPQMCTLLQYFCDCELRHRVEGIVAFSDQFVKEIQSNQRVRYNLLMRAFTMSAAETARKTREFRSPPQDQVHHEFTSEAF